VPVRPASDTEPEPVPDAPNPRGGDGHTSGGRDRRRARASRCHSASARPTGRTGPGRPGRARPEGRRQPRSTNRRPDRHGHPARPPRRPAPAGRRHRRPTRLTAKEIDMRDSTRHALERAAELTRQGRSPKLWPPLSP
jgi:hypothetical protein